MTMIIFSHDGRPLDLNPGLSECEAGMTLDVRCDRRPATFVSPLSTYLHNDRIILKRFVNTARACEAH
jgi:hypothetical protein